MSGHGPAYRHHQQCRQLSDISINKLVQNGLGPVYSARSLRVSFV